MMGLRLTAYNWADKFEIEESGKGEGYQTSNESTSQTQEEIARLTAEVERLEKSIAILSELHRESDLRCQELENLLYEDYQAKRKYEAEESAHQRTRTPGIDLEELYDAVILSHPPRERKLIGKAVGRFKTLIAEALTRRGVPVR